MDQKLESFKKDLDKSKNILVLTGAGIQTDSGIPDYRGINGIYKNFSEIPPEKLLTSEFFNKNQKKFYEFYNKFMIHPDAKPNIGHTWLKQLEDLGKRVVIITQNIDELHTKAGSSNVHEIHGSAFKFECTYCHKKYHTDTTQDAWPKKENMIPICPFCKHILKPTVVLYGDPIQLSPSEQIQQIVEDSNMVLVMGTQLLVQPANEIPKMANNKIPIYIVNLTDYKENKALDKVEYTLIQMKIQKFVKEINTWK